MFTLSIIEKHPVLLVAPLSDRLVWNLTQEIYEVSQNIKTWPSFSHVFIPDIWHVAIMVGKSKGKDSQMIVYIMIIMNSCALFDFLMWTWVIDISWFTMSSPLPPRSSRDGSWQPSSKSTDRKKTCGIDPGTRQKTPTKCPQQNGVNQTSCILVGVL